MWDVLSMNILPPCLACFSATPSDSGFPGLERGDPNIANYAPDIAPLRSTGAAPLPPRRRARHAGEGRVQRVGFDT